MYLEPSKVEYPLIKKWLKLKISEGKVSAVELELLLKQGSELTGVWDEDTSDWLCGNPCESDTHKLFAIGFERIRDDESNH